MSTVTKRIRRIGLFDYDKAKKAVRICRPDYIALTFVDYINPSDYQITQYEELSDEAKDFVTTIEKELEVPVLLLGTGPDIKDIIDRR